MARNKATKQSYSVEQRVHMVWFYAKTKSISRTQTKVVKHFNLDRKHGKPSKPTILGMVNKFLETGSVLDVHRSDRKKTGRSTADIDKIRRAILKSPKRSVRRLSTEHKVKRSTVHNILHKDLKKFPYKIQIKQKIKAVDKRARSVFCNWVSEQIEQKTLFLNNIWFGDEAHFHLSGHVNKQNMRFWGSENPHKL